MKHCKRVLFGIASITLLLLILLIQHAMERKELVAGLRATEHLNPALELKRQSAVARLEAVLVTADGPSFEVSSQSR